MTIQKLDTTTGAGDTLQAGGDKINANASQLGQRNARTSPIYCVFDGDSKTAEIQEAFKWHIAFEGLDVRVDGGTIGIGSTTTGTGTSSGNLNLLNPTRLASIKATLDAHSAAGHTVDYFLTIGTNDLAAATPPLTILANIRKFHETALRTQTCFRHLIIVSIDPRSTGAPTALTAGQIHTVNRLYDEYALQNSFDVQFVDTTMVWLDPAAANANGYPVPYTSTAAPMPIGAYSNDGLHASVHGMYVKRFALYNLTHLYRRKPQRSLSRAIVNGGGTGAYGGNMLPDGRTVAMGGTNSLTNSGSGSVTGTPPAGFTLVGAIDGSMGLAFSLGTVTIAADGGVIPRGVWPSVRLTFSGTSGAAAGVLQIYELASPDGSIALGEKVSMGSILHMNALVGLLGIVVSANNPTAVQGRKIGLANNEIGASPLAQGITTPITGPLFLEADDGPATSTQGGFNASVTLYWPANTPMSGSIDILSIFAERIGIIPAATA